MRETSYKQLTQQDVDHFLQHGWIKLSNCFTREQAAELTSNIWTRLGMSPVDKSTWHTEFNYMPVHKTFQANEFAPKAWDAICDLLGGEERLAAWNRTWNDGFIVNLGTPGGEGKDVGGSDLQGWHVDGDFFVHYLDSPEQALLVIPLFTDINPGGGGTLLCPDAIPKLAKYLYDHPEGVSPHMMPRSKDHPMDSETSMDFFNQVARSVSKDAFLEATGKVGDVYLLHPLVLHSASNNKLRQLRIITNPPVSLKAPFVFDRKDPSQYSLVERKTIAALGEDSLKGWKITHDRESIVPERIKRQEAMKNQEISRLDEPKKKEVSQVGSFRRMFKRQKP